MQTLNFKQLLFLALFITSVVTGLIFSNPI
jgi:hypothetical protein